MPIKAKHILKEESGAAKRACMENIANFIAPQLRPYLETPLNQLPEYFRSVFSQGATKRLWDTVVAMPEGQNRLIDYLRINLYGDFNIRNRVIGKFLKGISRIACDDCGYYTFSTTRLKAKQILKLRRLMQIISKTDEDIINQLGLDADFNGMSYQQLMDHCTEFLRNHFNDEENLLANYSQNGVCDYDIIKVPDEIVREGTCNVAKPTQQGLSFLRALAQYTDWCICDENVGIAEYSQYTQGGGVFYICLKHGFRTIQKPEIDLNVQDHDALDEYGLSMIAVIVGPDGHPESITTRWNHNFGGENNDGLWTASQLQQVLKINYHQVFKPRPQEELRRLGNDLTIDENNGLIKNIMGNKKIMTESQIMELVKNAALKSMSLMNEGKAKKKTTKKMTMTETQLKNFIKEATSKVVKSILKEDDDFADYEDNGYFNNFDDEGYADFEEVQPTNDTTNIGGEDEIERNIVDGCNPMVSQYLNTPLSELPERFSSVLSQTPIFDQLESRGGNLMDFLKQYMLQELGISEHSPLAHMLPGISRILSQECGFFSFDPRQTKISDIMNLINHLKSSVDAQGLEGFDSDLNGMSCQEVINAITQRVRHDDNAQFDFDSFLNSSANVLRNGEEQ